MLARARIAPIFSAQRVAGLRNASHRRSLLSHRPLVTFATLCKPGSYSS